jgi:hypothetical protein
VPDVLATEVSVADVTEVAPDVGDEVGASSPLLAQATPTTASAVTAAVSTPKTFFIMSRLLVETR